MATKKKAGRTGVVSGQHPDSKGVNAQRDGKRGAGVAAVTVPQGQGTASFRKKRTGGD
jgi:hypothetical protein